MVRDERAGIDLLFELEARSDARSAIVDMIAEQLVDPVMSGRSIGRLD